MPGAILTPRATERPSVSGKPRTPKQGTNALYPLRERPSLAVNRRSAQIVDARRIRLPRSCRCNRFHPGGTRMVLAHAVERTLLAGLLMLGAGLASSQDFPVKPIRLISPGPGGGADFVARYIAQGITGPLGQQVIVENRP